MKKHCVAFTGNVFASEMHHQDSQHGFKLILGSSNKKSVFDRTLNLTCLVPLEWSHLEYYSCSGAKKDWNKSEIKVRSL